MTTSQPIDASIEGRMAEQQARLAAMSFPHALAVVDRAADFELPNAHGRRIRLADQLERGSVVLIFYRLLEVAELQVAERAQGTAFRR